MIHMTIVTVDYCSPTLPRPLHMQGQSHFPSSTPTPVRSADSFDGILVNCRIQSIDPQLGVATVSLTFSVGGRYNLLTYTKEVTDSGLLYMTVPMAR